jgi:hypothetical protein
MAPTPRDLSDLARAAVQRDAYARLWALRAEREGERSMARWAEITREIEEETGRIGHLRWEQEGAARQAISGALSRRCAGRAVRRSQRRELLEAIEPRTND